MHVLCDFAMICLNFYTLLDQFGLTYYLSAPSCQFLFSAVFVFQVFRLFKVPKKFWKNYIKNQRDGTFRKNQKREGGPPPDSQEGWWRGPTLGRAGHPPGCLVGPLDTPLRLYLPLGVETPKTEPFFAKTSLFRRRCRFKIVAAMSSPPWTMG